MVNLVFEIFFIIALFFTSCSNSEPYHDENPSDVYFEEYAMQENSEELTMQDNPEESTMLENMVHILALHDTVILGRNIADAKISEKPEMKVVLDYDFFFDAHETSCDDFVSLMQVYGPKNGFAQGYSCTKKLLPIVDVTYYDAVLFANAKSIANKMDTVYSYESSFFDEEGHCTDLKGLVFHTDRKGFRLPTETEWVKAASDGFDAQNGWNNGNSSFELHEVCSRNVDKRGFCDLAGNAMEWVNDWLGYFRDTVVTNYVGAPDGGGLGVRIVKGGAFNTDPAKINTYSRGDVYTVTSSTRSNYVGFRLAYGTISNPVWMGNDGVTKASLVHLLASSTDIYPYTKSYDIELAFRNDESGNLAFVDYANGLPFIVEIQDTMDVYHPEISPDGKKVAFCTKLEGVDGNSALYVRNLDEKGSGLVKLDVASAAIPRWRVLENGDTVITYVTNAGNNQNEATWKNYSTWQVPFTEGKFGSPQKILDGSFHGGLSKDGRLAVTGARMLRARVDSKDSLWYNGEQACNVSMAQDGSKRTLFLDFGSKTGSSYVGGKYRVHQNLFVADSTGALIQYVTAPAGYVFDHSEWAVGNVNDNIIVSLTNSNGAHKKIALINLKDAMQIDLVEGEELWHPCLWVKSKTDSISSVSNDSTLTYYEYDLDSAGVYYNRSGVCANALYYRYKMEFMWQYKDSGNVVIVGSSRSLHGVMPLEFKKPIVAVNLAVSAEFLRGSKFLLENYVIPHYKHLKAVIISLDLDRAGNSGQNAYNMFYSSYKYYPGYVYDKNHDFWKGYDTHKLYESSRDALGYNEIGSDLRATAGYAAGNGDMTWGIPFVEGDSCWLDKNSEIFESNMDLLEELISTCQENGIILVGVLFPMNPRYSETGAYGRHGFRRSDAPSLIARIKKLSSVYSNFILLDENKMGNHDYTDEMARDSDHLGDKGALQLTGRLDSLLREQNIDWDN